MASDRRVDYIAHSEFGGERPQPSFVDGKGQGRLRASKAGQLRTLCKGHAFPKHLSQHFCGLTAPRAGELGSVEIVRS